MRLAKKDWGEAFQSAVSSGGITAVATAASVSLTGARDTCSAVAPINATSHIAWGESAAHFEGIDAKRTGLGMLLNAGACVFWATFYERYFGRAADRGDVGVALLGGGIVAAAAYVTDYHLVPKRMSPGWEHRLSGRSLAATYTVLALSLTLRGLLRKR